MMQKPRVNPNVSVTQLRLNNIKKVLNSAKK